MRADTRIVARVVGTGVAVARARLSWRLGRARIRAAVATRSVAVVAVLAALYLAVATYRRSDTAPVGAPVVEIVARRGGVVCAANDQAAAATRVVFDAVDEGGRRRSALTWKRRGQVDA